MKKKQIFKVKFGYVSEPRSEIVGNDKKREFLEKYGLNPDEFLPKQSRKVTIFFLIIVVLVRDKEN